jgi:superoxide dismutase, Fe-Mn family
MIKFKLPELPFKKNALEPYISEKTIEYHHEKHHKSYIKNLNLLISGTKFENLDLETLIKITDGPVFNSAAQVWNHTFYFAVLKSGSNHVLPGPFTAGVNESFGSFKFFKESFMKSADSIFGSGWVWLVLNRKGLMEIMNEINAGNPLRKGLIPLMACDLWEHAYYLDYQNRRSDYVKAFWKLIDWDMIEKRYNDILI